MPNDQRKQILNNLIGQLRQQQQHNVADAFYDILSCYPDFPLFKNEKALMLFFAWGKLYDLAGHPIVNQIVNQSI